MKLKKIYLRKKKNKNGTTTIFLEYYYGSTKNKDGKQSIKREYEFFNPAILLISDPKNSEERKQNKELEEIAKNVLKVKEIESLKNSYDFNNSKKQTVNLIDYFHNVMDSRDVKESSLNNWKSSLKHLLNYCNPESTTLDDVDEKFILGFKEYLSNVTIANTNNKLNNNTKLMYIAVLKTVLDQALREKLIQENSLKYVKNFTRQESKREYLTVEELMKLNDVECKKEVDKRAFLFSCLTGLRYSDIESLKWNQLENEDGNYKIIFKQKKTNGLEYLPLNNQAVALLGERGKPDDPIFKNLMYNNSLSNNIATICYKAGIKKHITFHSGRHTFATMLLNNGGDLYAVSKLLGHRNINTTQIYAKIVDKTKQDTINKIPELNFNTYS